MRIVAALLSAKVCTIIIVGAIPGAKTLLRGPGLDQRPVYGNVLVGHELLRLLGHLGEEPLGHTRSQQPIAVVREHRMVSHRIVHAQAHEPAKQKVVVDLLHQQSLRVNRVEHLQKKRSQNIFRRNRRPPDVRRADRTPGSASPGPCPSTCEPLAIG